MTLDSFDELDLGLRVARHRAEAERAAGYRLLEASGLADVSSVAERLEARLRAREAFLRGLLRRGEASDVARTRELLDAYLAARGFGTLLVSFVCRGRGFVRVFGEAPAESGERFLDSASGGRFARLCGVEEGGGGFEALSDVFRGRNVAEEPCDLPAPSAELRRALWRAGGFGADSRTSVTLLLGRTVATLAGLSADAPPFRWVSVGGAYAGRDSASVGVACYVPHPSGRSRWWNDSGNRSRGSEFLRRLVAEVRGRRLPVDGSDGEAYLPRMTEESLSFVDERAEPSWAVEALRLGLPTLATRGWRGRGRRRGGGRAA